MDMTKTLSLLYELSLAVGTSLDITTNAKYFVDVIMRKLNLDFVGVWLHDTNILSDISDRYTLIHAYPEFKIKQQQLPLQLPVLQDFNKKPFKRLTKEQEFTEIQAFICLF